MGGTAVETIRAALEGLLSEHGFAFDEPNNSGADAERPWLLFHADPPTRLQQLHPGWYAALRRGYEDEPSCLDIWIGHDSQEQRWRITGDLDETNLDEHSLDAVARQPLDVWLPRAHAALAKWFSDLDGQFP